MLTGDVELLQRVLASSRVLDEPDYSAQDAIRLVGYTGQIKRVRKCSAGMNSEKVCEVPRSFSASTGLRRT